MEREENNNEVTNVGVEYTNSFIMEQLKLDILKSLIDLDNETKLNIIRNNTELREILFKIYNKVKW